MGQISTRLVTYIRLIPGHYQSIECFLLLWASFNFEIEKLEMELKPLLLLWANFNFEIEKPEMGLEPVLAASQNGRPVARRFEAQLREKAP